MVHSGAIPVNRKGEFQTLGNVATRCQLKDTGFGTFFPLFGGFGYAWRPHVGLHAGPQLGLLAGSSLILCSASVLVTTGSMREYCRTVAQSINQSSIQQGGTGGAIPEPYKMTCRRSLVCMFLPFMRKDGGSIYL